MADKIITSTGDCTFCCSGGCSCALLIPPRDFPFVDYATALGVVNGPLVANCIVYAQAGNPITSSSATFDGITLTYIPNFSGPQSGYGEIDISISIEAGKTITITSANYTNILYAIYTCDGTLVETDTRASPITSGALAAGEYSISIVPLSSSAFTSDTLTVTASGLWWVNPVIALWDDSGTTRSLWACPKLLLPPLTEASGDWYASCADAATDISDRSSNCVGYYGNALTGLTFTATDGGTSLSFSLSTGGPPLLAAGPFWGGVNAVGGQTLSFASTGFTNGNVDIYDDAGVLVENLAGATPLTSSALPYTGRYTIKVTINAGGFPSSCTATITSSGTLSVNEIQAKFDLGLTCSGLLNCGDACP